jgi:type II secretory pathway component PulF
MPVYEYRTRKSILTKSSLGTIHADSPRKARDQLRERGIEFESIRCLDESTPKEPVKIVQNSVTRSPFLRSSQTISYRWNAYRLSRQTSWFTREMATLLRVGSPIVEAIDLTIAQSNSRMKPWLLRLRNSIQSGHTLAESMSDCCGVFSRVLIEMVRVGETAGTLPAILHQAAEFQDKKEKLRGRVGSAILYPSMVLLLSVFVTLFLMTVVVPTLLESLEEFGKELPWPTLVLKVISDFLLTHYWVLLSTLMLLAVALAAIAFTQRGQWGIHGLILKVPLLGNLIVKQNCSRLCMITGTLLSSGVELLRALEIAEGSVANLQLKHAIQSARERIRAGSDIGAAISMSSLLPVGLVQVFALGQNSGELDILLLEIAKDYEAQVNLVADRLATVLEPILIIGLSLIVGFILLATLLPILETGNVLSEQ